VVEAADRLIRAHNVRAFESYVGNLASATDAPCLEWASATVAAPRDTRAAPVVVVLIGLKRRALLALGFLHLVAWWRVRRAVGPRRQGYRVRVRFA
jgi:hypothetical protein